MEQGTFQEALIDNIKSTQYMQECLDKLSSLLQPSYYCLNLIVKILLHGPAGSGKRLLAQTVSHNLNMNFYEENVSNLIDENVVGTEKKIKTSITKAVEKVPCIVYMTNYELLCKLEDPDLVRIEHCIKETLEELEQKGMSQPLIFIAATEDFDSIHHGILSNIFHHDLSMKSPNYEQATEILRSLGSFRESETLNTDRILSTIQDKEYYIGNLIDSIVRANLADNQDKDPLSITRGTQWLDIGGLSEVKQEIIDTIQLSLDYPQLKKTELKRTGILLYGPPGTGKTLLAKAIANECNLNFVDVKGPELLNEYVGQSEDNVRKLFQKARESSPCVIFFDEFDSLAPNRGQAGDSGGVMDRIVSQILAEMDGVGKKEDVFIIAATNRVDLIDPSLLRPGRFDKVLEVPIPKGKMDRLQILQALTRKMNLAADVHLDEIESMLREDMSGADFQALCSRALHRTLDRCIEFVESSGVTDDEVEILTTRDDFVQCI